MLHRSVEGYMVCRLSRYKHELGITLSAKWQTPSPTQAQMRERRTLEVALETLAIFFFIALRQLEVIHGSGASSH